MPLGPAQPELPRPSAHCPQDARLLSLRPHSPQSSECAPAPFLALFRGVTHSVCRTRLLPEPLLGVRRPLPSTDSRASLPSLRMTGANALDTLPFRK